MSRRWPTAAATTSLRTTADYYLTTATVGRWTSLDYLWVKSYISYFFSFTWCTLFYVVYKKKLPFLFIFNGYLSLFYLFLPFQFLSIFFCSFKGWRTLARNGCCMYRAVKNCLHEGRQASKSYKTDMSLLPLFSETDIKFKGFFWLQERQ